MKKIVPQSAVLIPENAECVFEGLMFDIFHWQQKLYDGTFTTFEMLRRVDTVRVVAIKDDKLVLIDEQQILHAPNRHFPTGKVDKGEAWLAAAQREMREETGLQFANWKLVNVDQPFDQLEWFVATYLATDCSEVGNPELEGGEKSTTLFADFAEVASQVADGRDDLQYSSTLFHPLKSLEDLRALPEFSGQEIDR
jgi:ADP-ribose pyrophosphatase